MESLWRDRCADLRPLFVLASTVSLHHPNHVLLPPQLPPHSSPRHLSDDAGLSGLDGARVDDAGKDDADIVKRGPDGVDVGSGDRRDDVDTGWMGYRRTACIALDEVDSHDYSPAWAEDEPVRDRSHLACQNSCAVVDRRNPDPGKT